MRASFLIIALIGILLALPAAAVEGIDEVAIICDEPGAIAASRSGRSGRFYPCYSLERVSGVRFGGASLFCDFEGAIVSTRSGRSGRSHACYVLGRRVEASLRGALIICDDDEGSSASRSGIAGRRYGCYALAPVADPGAP